MSNPNQNEEKHEEPKSPKMYPSEKPEPKTEHAEKKADSNEEVVVVTVEEKLTRKDMAIAGAIVVAAVGGAILLKNPALLGAAAIKLGLKKPPVVIQLSRYQRLRGRLGLRQSVCIPIS